MTKTNNQEIGRGLLKSEATWDVVYSTTPPASTPEVSQNAMRPTAKTCGQGPSPQSEVVSKPTELRLHSACTSRLLEDKAHGPSQS